MAKKKPKKVTSKKKADGPAWAPRTQPVTVEQMRRFLMALMRDPNITKACKYAKANRTAIYQRAARDEQFSAALEECKAIGVDNLIDSTFELAHNGWEEPVFHEGEICGHKIRHSPTLRIFLIKAHDKRYKERFGIEHTGKGGGPLDLNVIMDPRACQEALDQMDAERAAAAAAMEQDNA